jgi:sialate O-acetylesterase
MVLQREAAVPIWGQADAGDDVTVEFGDQTVRTKAGANGKWQVSLSPLTASGQSQQLTISGKKNTVVLKDVVVGEVWLCSGQSNMEFPVGDSGMSVMNAAQEIAGADFPLIRQLKVPRSWNAQPQDAFKAEWTVCSPQTAGRFTAVGYFFARDLHKNLRVPIGLLNSSFGGTPIEAWLSEKTLHSDPAGASVVTRRAQVIAAWPKTVADYRAAVEAWDKQAADAKRTGAPLTTPRPRQPVGPGHPYMPVTVYNGMIHPLAPYAIRGGIWYQGEANADAGQAAEYSGLLKALIGQWRSEWREGDFPFYFVQLPNFKGSGTDPTSWAAFREAQARALSVPNTGMVVTIDIGDPKNIHPKDKQDVGHRIALVALTQTYKQDVGEYSGPSLKDAQRVAGGLVLQFDHASGMSARNGALTGFQIAGADHKFFPTNAAIEGKNIRVSSPEAPLPEAVRYAWENSPIASLFNGANLPASPFRTDSWTENSQNSSTPK